MPCYRRSGTLDEGEARHANLPLVERTLIDGAAAAFLSPERPPPSGALASAAGETAGSAALATEHGGRAFSVSSAPAAQLTLELGAAA